MTCFSMPISFALERVLAAYKQDWSDGLFVSIVKLELDTGKKKTLKKKKALMRHTRIENVYTVIGRLF